jgi:hypothetical protein
VSGGAAAAGRAWWGALPAGLQDRLVGVILAVPTSVVLGLAAWLEPAAGGVGTHKQLGLNGCAVLTATGWPCPMCGMTTNKPCGLGAAPPRGESREMATLLGGACDDRVWVLDAVERAPSVNTASPKSGERGFGLLPASAASRASALVGSGRSLKNR